MAKLVVGWGNELRSDDRAARVVAERVAQLELPDVTVRSVTQLVPELAIDVAAVDVVVFVDADVEADRVVSAPIDVAVRDHLSDGTATTHRCSPDGIVALATTLGRGPLAAHVVSIPVADLGIGERLSATATGGVDVAVRLIERLLDGSPPG